ncbi:MAG: polysaccharide deacetylase family protein [Lachnospiraceae bacterium]|nr:polysaccharide deacetylase family protein [Lachnospiraceae bacterium]
MRHKQYCWILPALIFICGIGILVQQAMKETAIPTAASIRFKNWGLSFQEEGKAPVTEVTAQELHALDAYYLGNEEEKKIYLTFDAGFENGNTEDILDALKKHNVPATFFVVGHYLESAPDMISRMVEEGHTVGNHTYNHKDMDSVKDAAEFQQEMMDVEELYRQITGKEMVKYYRPPQGKFSEEQLKWAQEMGYKTFFWSLAYVDWEKDNQPDGTESIEKLCKRIHPGAIVLLHSTSSTNAEIMDELIGRFKEMGYTFGDLSDFS